MSVPAELQVHGRARVGGDRRASTATIGITDLRDDSRSATSSTCRCPRSAPPCGAATRAARSSRTKSVSELYSPVDGEVTEVNEELNDDPGLINAEPYGLGWMFRVQVAAGQRRATGLLSPTEYDALTKSAG